MGSTDTLEQQLPRVKSIYRIIARRNLKSFEHRSLRVSMPSNSTLNIMKTKKQANPCMR